MPYNAEQHADIHIIFSKVKQIKGSMTNQALREVTGA
jgi:hypothetical protein